MTTTSFHCDKLCSGPCCDHTRKALALVLRDHVTCARIPDVARGDVFGATASMSAHAAIDDPAKLAELLAMALRARGLTVGDGISAAPMYDIHVFAISDVCMVHITRGLFDFAGHVQLPMSRSRTMLLAVMLTPADESSRDAVETILRSVP